MEHAVSHLGGWPKMTMGRRGKLSETDQKWRAAVIAQKKVVPQNSEIRGVIVMHLPIMSVVLSHAVSIFIYKGLKTIWHKKRQQPYWRSTGPDFSGWEAEGFCHLMLQRSNAIRFVNCIFLWVRSWNDKISILISICFKVALCQMRCNDFTCPVGSLWGVLIFVHVHTYGFNIFLELCWWNISFVFPLCWTLSPGPSKRALFDANAE